MQANFSLALHLRGDTKHNLRLLLCLSLSLLLSLSLFSQSRPLGSWNILNAKLTIDPHWSVWAEGQLRSAKFYDDFLYFEAKAGVNYNLSKSVYIGFGAGRYETYTPGGNFEDPLVVGENRTWFHLTMEQRLSRIIFEHRYRIEQRHLTTGYRNRFRYRLMATVPINHPENIPGTLFGYIGDEIFFYDMAPYYQRNRFFTGLGFKFSSYLSAFSGYMRQFDYTVDKQLSRDYLQVGVFLNFHLKDHVDHSVPTPND